MATKTTPSPILSSPARQLLGESIAAQQQALALVGEASAVVSAAAAVVEQARARSAGHHATHDDIIAARLAALREDPGAPDPDQLREVRLACQVAKEDLLEADQVLDVAKRELKDAQQANHNAEKTPAIHAVSVIRESVTALVTEWDQINRQRETLRVILDSLVLARVPLNATNRENVILGAISGTGLPYGDAESWINLQDHLGEVLSRNYSERDPGPARARARSYWASFAALLTDPAAEQPPLPGAAELFD